MSQRTPSAWLPMSMSVAAAASRSPGANALSCATSGHGGKYGSRPRAMTASPTCRKPPGSRARSSALPWTKYSGWSASQGWSGATWFGTKSSRSRTPRVGQRLAGGGQTGPPAEAGVDLVAADAVGRPDDVLVGEVGQRGVERRHLLRRVEGELHAGRAALPHAHQPHGIDATRRHKVPFGGGYVGQRGGRAGAATDVVQPGGGVELVDDGIARPAAHGVAARYTRFRWMAFDSKASGVRYPRPWMTRATRPVQPVWWLAPSPAPLSPWKYS